MLRQIAATVFLCFFHASLAFSQGGGASLTGVVTDPSGALLPGTTITVTNTETGVVNTTVTNESGAYNFPSLPQGLLYRVAASLPGFETKAVTDLELGVASTNRQDFQLRVAGTATTVEVRAADTNPIPLAGASVGDVLSQDRIMSLPLIDNNVLDLLDILPGLLLSSQGSQADTIGGLGMNTVNATRDGLSVVDGRYDAETWGRKTLSTTVLNPDLVGEIRLILSPVDAELGRGNAQVQIQTRSGTNRHIPNFSWNLQNAALNSNTWLRNSNAVNRAWSPIKPDWRNLQHYTVSYGGPIVPNRSFFFVLWDQNITNTRNLQQPTVLTPTATQGIFRYWTGWDPGPAGSSPIGSFGGTYPSVDDLGNPVAPLTNPGDTPYMGELRCFSVFGDMKLVDGSMVPFTPADCQGGTAAFFGGGAWDPKRPVADTTGYIARILTAMPEANYFRSGDGLNTAGLQYIRGRRGSTNGAFAITGTDAYSNRRNLNVKIDQHVGAHRINGNWSYQLDDNTDNIAAWPDAINGVQRSRPQVITLNATSTLGSRLVNEARFGLNRNSRAQLPAWRSPNDSVRAAAEALFVQGGVAANGTTYPVVPDPTAAVNFRTISGAGQINPNSVNIGNTTSLYNYADTISWTLAKHAFRFGAELRFPRSNGFNLQTVPVATFGNNESAGSTVSPFTNATLFTGATELPGLPQSTRYTAAALSYFLNGSVSHVTHQYWMENQRDRDSGMWQDYATRDQRYRNQILSEYAFFAKDDYKLTSRLTLNVGIRYEFYGSPYLESGLTSAPSGLGAGLFGASRGAGGLLFDNWLQPGNLFLTGYGSNTGTPLDCRSGVTQSALLPVSNCDPGLLTTIEFVGPNTPNPDRFVIPNDMNNFAPNIGFAYQAPWFGGMGVMIRGGYGMTYGSAGRNGIALDTLLGSAPGNTLTATTSVTDANIAAILANRALNLSDLPALVPVRPVRPPGADWPIYARSASFTAYDPNFVTPYTQNFTLSVTRQMNRKLTLEVRYIGTLARKLAGNINLNESTVFYNPELFDALVKTRAGEDVELFDLMFAGLNLGPEYDPEYGGEAYGPVGTVVNGVLQRGSAHLRRNSSVGFALANGDFENVSNQLVTLAAASGHQNLPIDPATGLALTNVQQRVLRNGCDRIANGLYDPANPWVPTNTAATANIPTRCFPENYLQTNPQLATATYNANLGHNNHHTVQVQGTFRLYELMNVQATYAWAKSMEQRGSGFSDPLQRDRDFQRGRQGAHSLRMNGTLELPIGPNRLLLGRTSGWLGRLIERWQTGFILNLASGPAADVLGAGNMRYGNARMNVTPHWETPQVKSTWDRSIPNGQIQGSWYGTPSPFISVRDPQCTSPLVVQTDNRGYNFGDNCTLDALGIIVPAGTPDSSVLGNTSYVLGLVNPTPGGFGNLPPRTLRSLGQFQLDANLSKTFKITETKNVQLRIDCRNVLNHPTPNSPNFNIAGFGQINGKVGSRTVQANLRLGF